MANYLKDPTRFERLPVGAVVVAHGKNSSFDYVKTATGWDHLGTGGRIVSGPSGRSKTNEGMIALMQNFRIELRPLRRR